MLQLTIPLPEINRIQESPRLQTFKKTHTQFRFLTDMLLEDAEHDVVYNEIVDHFGVPLHERGKYPRKEVDRIKLQMCAHVFFFTTRDGMIISKLAKVSPLKLWHWTRGKAWKDELHFGSYDGNPDPTGDEFHQQVKAANVKVSLRKAGRLWREMFGLTTNTNELHRFFGNELQAIKSTIKTQPRKKGQAD